MAIGAPNNKSSVFSFLALSSFNVWELMALTGTEIVELHKITCMPASALSEAAPRHATMCDTIAATSTW